MDEDRHQGKMSLVVNDEGEVGHRFVALVGWYTKHPKIEQSERLRGDMWWIALCQLDQTIIRSVKTMSSTDWLESGTMTDAQ